MKKKKKKMEEKKEEKKEVSEINLDRITFGKYENAYIQDVLKDRKYCKWLLDQHWFETSYPYLHKKVVEYKPLTFFLTEEQIASSLETTKMENFTESFYLFHLRPLGAVTVTLNEKEQICYEFYLKTIQELKTKINVRKVKNEKNIYDIKAPSKWLQKFEDENKEKNITREEFKQFLSSYELPNITTVLEQIKKQGDIEYKGSQSFKIARKRSSEQELYWEQKLKEKYGEKIGSQFKFQNCFFDFINISCNTIFECKLGIKDFNEEQYNKYLMMTKEKYNIIYLIGYDCVINMDMETIYTTNMKEYLMYQLKIPLMKNPSKFDEIIFDYDLCEIDDLMEVI